MKFFSVDSPLYKFMNRLMDVFKLNCMWLLCSLPIVTMGAATTAAYTITLKMVNDEEGYINEVIITENGANTGTSQTPNQTPSGTSDLHAAIFNAKFNNYIGNITGSKINDLLRIATESVTNDPSHPITINSNTITDLSEIMPTETYMITPAYDSAGYINTLNIDKIM